MKKIMLLIFGLSLLLATPFVQASDLSPPEAVETVFTVEVEEYASTYLMVAVEVFYRPVLEFSMYYAMDAAREKNQTMPQKGQHLRLLGSGVNLLLLGLAT